MAALLFVVGNTDVMFAHEVLLFIVGADDDEAVAAVLVDQSLIEGHAGRVEVGAGFVQQQYGHIAEDGQREFDALFHAGGKIAELFVSRFFQSHHLHGHGGCNAGQQGLELGMEGDDLGEGKFFYQLEIGSCDSTIPEKRIGSDGFFRCAVLYGAFIVLNGAADNL